MNDQWARKKKKPVGQTRDDIQIWVGNATANIEEEQSQTSSQQNQMKNEHIRAL